VADVAHDPGADLSLTSTGDIALVDGASETRQRILRRLVTSAGTYIWQLNYGAGLPGLIGNTTSAQQIGAIVRAQLALEASVATTPEPTVSTSSDMLGSVSIVITYTDADSGQAQTLSLPLGG